MSPARVPFDDLPRDLPALPRRVLPTEHVKEPTMTAPLRHRAAGHRVPRPRTAGLVVVIAAAVSVTVLALVLWVAVTVLGAGA